MAITTCNTGGSTLTIWPVADDGLAARIAQGEENPIRGWANEPAWRSVPTAIFSRRTRGVTHFVQVLYPQRHREPTPLIGIEKRACAGAVAVAVHFEGKRTDVIAFNDQPGQNAEVDGETFSSELLLMRCRNGERRIERG